MSLDSNFYVLSHYRLKPSIRERRLQCLYDTLAQLQEYHVKAKPNKQKTIARMIIAYDNLIEKLTGE